LYVKPFVINATRESDPILADPKLSSDPAPETTTKVCAKCGSSHVHRVPQTDTDVSIAITPTNTASIDYYVCANCGFVELYVQDKSLLTNIAEKYSEDS
jgi:predicted nucleic-acid-binding Zn-ribbon protein